MLFVDTNYLICLGCRFFENSFNQKYYKDLKNQNILFSIIFARENNLVSKCIIRNIYYIYTYKIYRIVVTIY